jgi:hypothetical protein
VTQQKKIFLNCQPAAAGGHEKKYIYFFYSTRSAPRCAAQDTKIIDNFNVRLNPCFITGFADAECCFYVRISKKPNFKVG